MCLPRFEEIERAQKVLQWQDSEEWENMGNQRRCFVRAFAASEFVILNQRDDVVSREDKQCRKESENDLRMSFKIIGHGGHQVGVLCNNAGAFWKA